MIEYLRVLRLDHWLKNVFIFFGHLVAIALLPAEVPQDKLELVSRITLSLVPACLIASANYIINEILDAPFDRMHPTKRLRPVPAGTVKIPILWVIMAVLVVVAFAFAASWFNIGYIISLALLLLSGVLYNVEPFRLKDRAYLDVIAESFNNPIRLWLGWFALLPANVFPPLSIVLAWWFFGALLMAGKRYAEFRFIGDARRSGDYRRSFRVYTGTVPHSLHGDLCKFFLLLYGYCHSGVSSKSRFRLPARCCCNLRLSSSGDERGGGQARAGASSQEPACHRMRAGRCCHLGISRLDKNRSNEEGSFL